MATVRSRPWPCWVSCMLVCTSLHTDKRYRCTTQALCRRSSKLDMRSVHLRPQALRPTKKWCPSPSASSPGLISATVCMVSLSPPQDCGQFFNFSHPPEGVRSRFKVLVHSTGYGECTKPIRNIVGQLLGGEKLSTVAAIHLHYQASRWNDTLAFC